MIPGCPQHSHGLAGISIIIHMSQAVAARPGMMTTGCLAWYPLAASCLPGREVLSDTSPEVLVVEVPPMPGSCASRSLMVRFMDSREKSDREGIISESEMFRLLGDRSGADGIRGASRCMVACRQAGRADSRCEPKLYRRGSSGSTLHCAHNLPWYLHAAS
jgi:hypothetical protein